MAGVRKKELYRRKTIRHQINVTAAATTGGWGKKEQKASESFSTYKEKKRSTENRAGGKGKKEPKPT